MFSSQLRPTVSRILQGVKNHKFAASIAARAMSSEATTYQFETLNVTRPAEYVVQVELNRPEKRNAMSMTMYNELIDCFKKISSDADCRAVVVSGAGKIFTAGIDLMELATGVVGKSQDMEAGRRAFFIRDAVFKLQESMNVLEKCPKPVIAAVHSACVGAGVDLVTAADIRYCDQSSFFQIKEVDVGLAADLGTLQRLPKIVGNESLVRELAFTARKLHADEAKQFGLVSRVFPDRDSLVSGAIELAAEIGSKSPVAVQGTKINLLYARDHPVNDGLDYVLTWNQAMLQSEDLMKAGMAAMQKEKATFSKL